MCCTCIWRDARSELRGAPFQATEPAPPTISRSQHQLGSILSTGTVPCSAVLRMQYAGSGTESKNPSRQMVLARGRYIAAGAVQPETAAIRAAIALHPPRRATSGCECEAVFTEVEAASSESTQLRLSATRVSRIGAMCQLGRECSGRAATAVARRAGSLAAFPRGYVCGNGRVENQQNAHLAPCYSLP